jgi:hypothetical protein
MRDDNNTQPEEDDYFGLCPVCHRNDGALNYHRSHFIVCHEHRKYWWIGSNLFSNWREETEEDWKRTADVLDGYEEVEPYYRPKTIAA